MASELGRTLLESRPKDSTSTPEELLVFGYSCKLFRDNEKATYLEKGKHLIPWMGDNKLMVDRFDVRGALYDLKEAESGGGADRWEGMTEEEKAEEERCDTERYLALYHDEFQHQANQEEEAKRILAELGSDNYTYSQVGFSYDEQAAAAAAAYQNYVEEPPAAEVVQDPVEPPQEEEEEEEDPYYPEMDDDTYVPVAELNVPQGMVVPETVKQNKIILKTSKFIAAQGGQMEILIKTKQAGNPMFSFLAFDHPLNAFYKHTTSMIKSGRYRPAEGDDQERGRRDGDLNEGQYLHPSLSAGIKPDLTPGTPSSLHKPSADCSYSKLINKIKEKQKNSPTVEGIESPGSPSVPAITSTPVAAAVPVVAAAVPVVAVTTPAVITAAPVIVTSTPIAADKSDDADGASLKKRKKGGSRSPEVKSLVDYPSFNRTTDNYSDDERKDDESGDWKDKPGLSDDSDSDSDSDDPLVPDKSNEYSNIKWPPPDVQMVIDKMASYIIKNGEDFESMVSSRDDPRFSFLKTDHEYFPYYRCKMRLYNEVYGDIFKESIEEKNSNSSGDPGNGATTNGGGVAAATSGSTTAGGGSKKDKRLGAKVPSTISFSIKSREQEVNLDRHSTFPVESSSTDDEDMDEEEKERRKIEREERRRKRKLKEKEERERREREEKEKRERLEKEKLVEKTEESTDASDDNEDVYDIFKYAQEMGGDGEADEPNHNEKFSNGELKKPRANSLGGQGNGNDISGQPERKQQERRKKAAMFLSRLKKGSEDEASQPVFGPQLPPEIAAQMLNSTSRSASSSSRSSRHTSSRSRSRSSSPGSGIPMPPQDSPAPPPPPPPIHSPSPAATSNFENEWGSNPEVPTIGDYGEEYQALKRESSVLSGASEDDRRSQSVEIRSSKSRHVESSHREKSRSSRKKHRHERSETRSPSSRRERKKRKRSRSRSRRHKKRRSRSRSHSKSHSKSSHKKKRRKHGSRHERSERRNKKSRRSVSSSSSDTSELSYSSRSSSPSESEVQVIDSPSQSKRESRASSVVSVYASDLSILSSGLPRILEESLSAPGTPPLPTVPPSPGSSRLASVAQEKLASDRDSAAELGNGMDNESESGAKEEKKEEKKLFDPQTSAAMAKIAQGLRAKVHALLDKESKL